MFCLFGFVIEMDFDLVNVMIEMWVNGEVC